MSQTICSGGVESRHAATMRHEQLDSSPVQTGEIPEGDVEALPDNVENRASGTSAPPAATLRLCKCGCGRVARAQRRYSNTCRSKRYDNPLLRLYRNLKASAKRRHKEFSLDRDGFVRWIVNNGYAVFHGRYRTRLHIDRIKPWRGYEWGNVQILTCAANCRKRWSDMEARA